MKAFEEHLQKSELLEAKEILDKNKQDLDPSIYYFNLGRVYAKNDEWPEARIAFLKSQKSTPRKETESNLTIVEHKMVVSEIEAPRTFKDYFINSTYFLGTEIALTFNLTLLVWALWSYRRSRNVKKFIGITLVMLVLSGLSFWVNRWPWYIAESEVNVYHGPSEIFDKVQIVPKGIKVLGVEKDSWIQIIYPSRLEGWIKKENISEL